MAPKKKPAKEKKEKEDRKGKKDAKPAGLPGDVEGASIEELNQKIATLEKEKNKEEEYRNYMQLERDKINSFWEITKRDLEDRRAELRNKDREVEELEEGHQGEVKVYKQKVKHLLYEQQSSLVAAKTDGERSLQLMQEEARRREAELVKEQRGLRRELQEQDVSHAELVRSLRIEAAKEAAKLRQEFEGAAKALQSKYEKRMKMLRDEMELQRKQEVHEIEERKNGHINTLLRRHEADFGSIKAYYNDITHANLDLIKALKEDCAEMKRREAANEKLMYEIAQENKRLSQPLAKALAEVESLRGQLASADKDRAALKASQARLGAADNQVKGLEWQVEVLSQRCSALQQERDALNAAFESSVHDVQQKTGLKSLALEQQVLSLSQALETTELQLGEVLASGQPDAAAGRQAAQTLEQVLASKNATIRALQGQVAKVSKAHNDIVRVYEAKLAEYGIPAEDLGFQPLLLTTTSKGPAGLVTAGA